MPELDNRGDVPEVVGEPRWPMACAVLLAMALTMLLPGTVNSSAPYLLAGLEGLLLVALIVGDPGAIDRREDWLRKASIVLVGLLVFTAFSSTIVLIVELVQGEGVADDPEELLQTGGTVWVLNVIAFAFYYWEIDRGGAAARAHELNEYADFAFPQQQDPDLAPANWRPTFPDYLYLAFTAATAFSPTDAMPLTRRVKFAMMIQAAISLTVLGLVIARAVNVFA